MTEEERFWQEKEKQAKTTYGTKIKKTKEEKQYDLLIDNQVDFVKSDLLTGLMEKQLKKEKTKKSKKRARSDSSESSDNSSMSEEKI